MFSIFQEFRLGPLNLHTICTIELLVLQYAKQIRCLVYAQTLLIWKSCTFDHALSKSSILGVAGTAKFRLTYQIIAI